ncbi:CoA transferase [Candidatus Amarobacter glycogenicus]|uniref:CaiB/BaiF CoA transferase family protein n=1 Tax=Candidatus Amarobacter glycogenicus TaxID=3140699 RepID=UPI002A105E07|nr:CoA transferase [Dehalococcoidia bacterium]
MSGPLTGLRVIEYTGPLGQLAGKLLADMGADVVAIEPPAGSPARAVGPFVDDVPGPDRSLNYWYHNTNKRSVIVDLTAAEGVAAWKSLVAKADIVIEDCAPGELDTVGLGHASLRPAVDSLIWCSITPFGQTGPWASYQATDMVGLALGGPMMMNGYDAEDVPGAPPIRGHGDQGYNTACHYAVQGILAALLYRDKTGQGQHVDASMHEACSSTTEVGLPYWFTQRKNVIRQTGRHAAAQRTEPWLHMAADGRHALIFGVGRDNASWKRIKEWFQADGFGKQLDEPRFDEPAARQPGRGSPEAAEVMSELSRFIAAHSADEVYRGGQERRQSWGVVRAPSEALGDPHWEDRGFWTEVSGEGRDAPVRMPGAPYAFSATPWELRRPAPKLGEHTAEVLAEWLT